MMIRDSGSRGFDGWSRCSIVWRGEECYTRNTIFQSSHVWLSISRWSRDFATRRCSAASRGQRLKSMVVGLGLLMQSVTSSPTVAPCSNECVPVFLFFCAERCGKMDAVIGWPASDQQEAPVLFNHNVHPKCFSFVLIAKSPCFEHKLFHHFERLVRQYFTDRLQALQNRCPSTAHIVWSHECVGGCPVSVKRKERMTDFIQRVTGDVSGWRTAQ
jgi:hypothetical protein